MLSDFFDATICIDTQLKLFWAKWKVIRSCESTDRQSTYTGYVAYEDEPVSKAWNRGVFGNEKLPIIASSYSTYTCSYLMTVA